MDRRPKTSSRRRFRGQPRIVVWCARKDCGLSVPAAVAFCSRHLREVFKILQEQGLLRPLEELVPVSLRPPPRITKS